MAPVQMKLFFNDVERVLHAPGNLQEGKIVEMAIVLDYNVPCEMLKDICRDVILTLKKKGDMFRNIRLNVIKWISDEVIVEDVMPLSMLAIGRGFEDYGEYIKGTCKHIDKLAERLKLFYARSKLIIMVTDGEFRVYSEKVFREHLQPFLHKKWIWLDIEGNSKGRVSGVALQEDE